MKAIQKCDKQTYNRYVGLFLKRNLNYLSIIVKNQMFSLPYRQYF